MRAWERESAPEEEVAEFAGQRKNEKGELAGEVVYVPLPSSFSFQIVRNHEECVE